MSFIYDHPTEDVKFVTPSHGFLRVERAKLQQMGILADITPFSHQSPDGRFIFLEEDDDQITYAIAAGPTYRDLRQRMRIVLDNSDVISELPGFSHT